MNELIKVNSETMTVSARDLHKALGIAERFSLWASRYSDLMNEYGVTPVGKPTEVHNNGGIQIMELTDYDLPVDLAKHICMMSKTQKGKEIRQYFIDLEKVWNTPEQVMARALKIANQTIESLKVTATRQAERIEEMRPKEIFADAVSASHTSILIGDLAKLICQNGYQIGQKRLFQWLRAKGYLIKSGASYNMPTQRYVEQGLFEVKESNIQNPDGSIRITRTTKVTGKGQVYFVNKFMGAEP